MGEIRVEVNRTIPAPVERVYDAVADIRQRPAWLPPEFSNFRVEQGGHGAGTVVSFTIKAGGRERRYHLEVTEPAAHTLQEQDTNSSLVTTYRVQPHGAGSQVSITTVWQGAGGVGGFFERTFAPRVLKRIYQDELDRLAHVLA